MIGKLLAKTIKVVALPVTALNVVGDMMVGGDGSKQSRMNHPVDPLVDLENLADRMAEAAKEIDKD